MFLDVKNLFTCQQFGPTEALYSKAIFDLLAKWQKKWANCCWVTKETFDIFHSGILLDKVEFRNLELI